MPISAMHFEGKKIRIEEKIDAQKALEYVRAPHGVWLDVIKESNEELREILSLIFPEYYSLILEDCIEDTRPKIERYKDFTFVVIKTMPKRGFEYSQMSIIIGDDFLLTIRHGLTDLGPVKKFFARDTKQRFGVDFVVYKMLEYVLQRYLIVLDGVEDDLEKFERIALAKPKISNLAEMMHLKRQLFKLHKILAAQREIIAILFRGEIKSIKPKTRIYLRDAYDDIARLIDLEETSRESVTGLTGLNVQSVQNEINEVIKVLTIISMFGLPPLLVSSIYGMNFLDIPYIHSPHGFFVFVALSLAGMAMTYVYFKKKGWLDL